MPASSLRIGIDLVQVSRITESIDKFGERFLRRVFTDGEIAYAMDVPAQTAARLAARFAAKEATVKALGLVEQPMSWRDIEVSRAPSGACTLRLRANIARAAERVGVSELALSMSHEGDFATAVVIARMNEASV